MSHWLDGIESPADLRRLSSQQLTELAKEIRDYLVKSVSATGGHLGPNLGVVELTIALHRVFDCPRDAFVFDTGHQTYVHKLLTGRKDFSHLRQAGGLSGYPSRLESPCDILENSHASAGLAWADGIARANRVLRRDGHVVVVVGDGALTGGMSWEALNNIADEELSRLIIVVNDNGRSYAPTIGGLAHHLDALRVNPGYEKVLQWGKETLQERGKVGQFVYDALHGMKKGIKDMVAPQVMFEDLGIKYTGPVDGHDITALEFTFTRVRAYNEPVIVHVITEKGRGYTPAELNDTDRFHSIGKIHIETGLPIRPENFAWGSVFGDEILHLARQNPNIVGITAAMLEPVGLGPMQKEFPDRVFDVGIAEQEAVAAAAGMAYGGLHPVFAVYSTFLNRAYDQLLMDAALHHAGITVVEDRAGVTGSDGASHNGMWDIALLATIPGLRLAAPRDEGTLRAALDEAVMVDNAPTVIRYPRGSLPEPIQSLSSESYGDILFDSESADKPRVLIVACGAFATMGVEAAGEIGQSASVRVVDPRWIIPVNPALVAESRNYDLIVTLEDGLKTGGFGSLLRDALSEDSQLRRVVSFGIPKEFLPHASRGELLKQLGLTPADVARKVTQTLQASVNLG